MRFKPLSTLLVSGALLVAAQAHAQSIADIPACAQTCLLPALQATGCSMTDFNCICGSAQFVSGSKACILKACSTADAEKAAKATYQLCAPSVGVPTQNVPPQNGSQAFGGQAKASAAAAPTPAAK